MDIGYLPFPNLQVVIHSQTTEASNMSFGIFYAHCNYAILCSFPSLMIPEQWQLILSIVKAPTKQISTGKAGAEQESLRDGLLLFPFGLRFCSVEYFEEP